jgi:hypothetical protein
MDPDSRKVLHLRFFMVPGFESQTDFNDEVRLQFTDGTPIMGRRYHFNLESSNHRDQWTGVISQLGLIQPTFSKFLRKQ